MRIAMVGTRGVPARYGGFETCVEEVGARLVQRGHDVVVYCRTVGDDPAALPRTHLGMRLVHLPAVHAKVAETLSHTGLSVAHLAAHRVDAAVVFNAANSPLLPGLRALGVPVATHVDGLEWKRAKWGGAGRRYYRRAESLAVRWSDALIADATGIADYYTAEFGADTELISYGAPARTDVGVDLLDTVGLAPRRYHLVVARFEPENHVDVVVDGYRRSGARLPLVVVGSAPYNDAYTAKVHSLADERVRFLGGVWDQRLLDQLYANAVTYLHGHSVGGTNPSLLRAIGAGAPVLALGVGFNSEVLGAAGRYFDDAADVARLLEGAEADPVANAVFGAASVQAAARYDWDDVAGRYEDLCRRLPEIRRARRAGRLARPTGARRSGTTTPTMRPVTAVTGSVAVAPDDGTTTLVPAVAAAGATTSVTPVAGTTVTAPDATTSSASTAPPTGVTTGFLCSDFDLLHVGDLHAVEQARSQCGRLIVAVLSDGAVLALTGQEAVVGERERAEIVQHVRGVDDVVIVDAVDPGRWRAEHEFDVLFHGPGTGLSLAEDLPPAVRLVVLAGERSTSSATLRETVDTRWSVSPRAGASS